MKKKLIFAALVIVAVVILAVAAGIGYLKLALPNVGPAIDIKVDMSPDHVERGKYLANHVAVCIDCHSTRDWTHFSGPVVEGTFGKGGQPFGHNEGFPGDFYSRNLTPAHLKTWTDGEIFRAVTSGVSKDGTALFPVMPYHYYGQADQADILDIIAYLRTLPPIENDVPASRADFPMSLIINTIPSKPSFSQRPNSTDTVAYGKYLVNMASCMECHTQDNKGTLLMDKAYAGGRGFVMPGGVLRSSNITPDQTTGIGNWTESAFLDRFRAYAQASALQAVPPNEFNTIMPWNMYAGMKDEDLKAILAYLRTVSPVQNRVTVFTKTN